MRYPKLFTTIILVLVCVLFVSGCSGGQEDLAAYGAQRVADTPTSDIPERATEIATGTERAEMARERATVISTPQASPTSRPGASRTPRPRVETPVTRETPVADGEAREEPEREELSEMPLADSERAMEELGRKELSEESPKSDGDQLTELPPGNSINFSARLSENDEDRFLFLATSGSVVLVHAEGEGDLEVKIEVFDMKSGEALTPARQLSDQKTSLYQIPVDGGPLYRILLRGVDGATGDYSGFFIGSVGVGFNLSAHYAVIGRLAEEGALVYTYTGKGDSTIEFNLLPEQSSPMDLAVDIYNLGDFNNPVLQANESGVGEREEFLFTLTEEGLSTYLIFVKDAQGNPGEFRMTIDNTPESNSSDDLTRKRGPLF